MITKLNEEIKRLLEELKGLPEDSAREAIDDVKYAMKKVSSGSDWRQYKDDNSICLEVRYWGDWENPDDAEDEEDYDWQELSWDYRDKLDSIISEISKKYNVRIHREISEKNWIIVYVNIEEVNNDNVWQQFLSDIKGNDITGPIQKKRGKYVATVSLFTGGNHHYNSDNQPKFKDYRVHITPNEDKYDAYIVSEAGRKIYNTKGSLSIVTKNISDFIKERNTKQVDNWKLKKDKQNTKIQDNIKELQEFIREYFESMTIQEIIQYKNGIRLTIISNDSNKYDISMNTSTFDAFCKGTNLSVINKKYEVEKGASISQKFAYIVEYINKTENEA